MSAPLLTAALIVRDERRHLPDCLTSLQGIVDEILVVDTGSTDDSVAIATSFGARVLHHVWTDDFSAARNVGLDAASGRWILYIDADERLEPVARADVEALLENADEFAFRVRLRPRVGWTPYLEYRLWRSDPRVRFEGVIHEKIVFALVAAAEADGRKIGDCALTLDHLGYEGDQTTKHERNLPLLRAQLAGEPDNIFNWTHLGRALAGLGRRHEAEVALEQAVTLARRIHNEHGGVAFAELAAFRNQQGRAVADLLAEGRDRWPDNLSLVWLDGCQHLAAGRDEEAVGCLARVVAADPVVAGPVAYDRRLFGPETHAALGLGLLRLGRHAEAAAAYARAEDLAPETNEYRVKRLFAESRARAR